jgi:hypothetical protein
MRSNEEGISESIGFMLIFTIVIAGIAIVTLYGYPLLLQQQLGAEEKIMEKNMIVLQNDMKSLAYKTVPNKETALKIGGGSLTVYNSSHSQSSSYGSSTITILESGNPTVITSFQPGELRYESVSAQTDISLQNGGVAMRPRNQNGSTMLADPRWYYDWNTNTQTGTLVFNLMNISSDTVMAKEGIGTVRMTMVREPYYNYTTGVNPVVIEYTPYSGLNGLDYSVAWDNFMRKTFSNQQGLSFSQSGTPGNPLTYPLRYTLSPSGTNTITVVIKRFDIEIEAV